MNATVKDVMTTHVVAVRKNAPFKEIAGGLKEHRVSAFPVLDDEDKVVGVVSSGAGKINGILHHREQSKAAGVTAVELMTTPAVTIGPDEFVSHAARLMYARRVKRLPVVDDDGRLVGIVSRADVLSVYARPDAEIRHEIVERVIVDTLLTDPDRFTITVRDGIVTAEGMPETVSVGHDMIEEIRHVEGVVTVRDRLSYPPARFSAPASGPLF